MEGSFSPGDGAEEPSPEDVFRILVATDLHLGAFEKNRHRCHDSFVTFEEILRTAAEQEVDFILLGGDLFHENKPSHATLQRTTELLRRYCLGDKAIHFRLVSQPERHFGGAFRCANYEDPNLNVALPVFCIHGNHDDPTGPHQLSAIDLLSTSGLVNYFGKATDFSRVEVDPILLQKGQTKLALYGLGYIPDERLNRLLNDHKVRFLRPAEDPSDWFSLLCLHQNRHQRGLPGLDRQRGHAVTDEMLRGFFDLVVWGHEHECIPKPYTVEPPSVGGTRSAFDILQPGSSIVTSLSPEEAKPKHCVLLEVHGTCYKTTWMRLASVRPYLVEDVVLASEDLDKSAEEVKDFLTEKVETLLNIAHDKFRYDAALLEQNPSLPRPLIRLRVDYSPDYPTMNPQQFGASFLDRVANPTEILHPLKLKRPGSVPPRAQGTYQKARHQEEASATIDDLVLQFLQLNELDLLEEEPLTDAVKEYVDKAATNAITEAVNGAVREVQKEVWRFSKAMCGEFGREQVYDKVKDIKQVKKHRDASDLKEDTSTPFEPAGDMPNFEDSPTPNADTGVKEEDSSSPARQLPSLPFVNSHNALNGGRGRGRGRGAKAKAKAKPSDASDEVQAAHARRSSSRPNMTQLAFEEAPRSAPRAAATVVDIDVGGSEGDSAGEPSAKRPKTAPGSAPPRAGMKQMFNRLKQ